MLTLPTGHAFTFCCASGALGFDGDGWWWEQPLRWLGLLRPREFTIITKTLTLEPRAGNLRWWCPWRCARLIPGGAVNAVGLTNPGLDAWLKRFYPRILRRGYQVIVSIQPTDSIEAVRFARKLDTCSIVGIEVNASCPNVHHAASYDPVAIVRTLRVNCRHPLLVKLAGSQIDLIPILDPWVDAFDLINTVPWKHLFPDQPSPLARYGLEGGVSGAPLQRLARTALARGHLLTEKPIVSGGGIDSLSECLLRESLGASAFSLGTLFLRRPWEPNRIVRRYAGWK